jgi:Domain of unknown function (DUF1707)
MSEQSPVPYEPTPELSLRVGDAERYQAASALGEHFATGRLDQEEYDTRVKDAYAARTRADLQRLFADLPAPAPFRPTSPPSSGWAAGRAAREWVDRRPAGRFPVPPVVLILVVFVVVSLIARFPVFPVLFLLWFGWGRRAWR